MSACMQENRINWSLCSKFSTVTDVQTMLTMLQVEDTCLLALATAFNARQEEGANTKRELFQLVEEVSVVCHVKLRKLSCHSICQGVAG